MGKHIDAALKQQVLEAIKNGLTVLEASAQFGVSDKAIYAGLKAQADNTGTSALEMAKLRRENEELKEIVDLFALDKRRAEKIRSVRERIATLKTTKTALAYKLGVARSSLYYKPKKPPQDSEDKGKIIAVMEEHSAYGARRIAWALGMNRKKTKRLMHLYGLKPKLRRGFRLIKLDDLGRPETRIENIFKVICPIQPIVVWAGDFTYIWFVDRFWYVATIIDVYTREIVGWHIGNHHTTALIMDAFQDATRRTNMDD